MLHAEDLDVHRVDQVEELAARDNDPSPHWQRRRARDEVLHLVQQAQERRLQCRPHWQMAFAKACLFYERPSAPGNARSCLHALSDWNEM